MNAKSLKWKVLSIYLTHSSREDYYIEPVKKINFVAKKYRLF